MESQITEIIKVFATIAAPIITGWFTIKVKNMELKAKEAKTGEVLTLAEKKAASWSWGFIGVILGIVVTAIILLVFQSVFSNQKSEMTIQKYPSQESQVTVPAFSISNNTITLSDKTNLQSIGTPESRNQEISLQTPLSNTNLSSCSSFARGETYTVTPEKYIVGDVVVDEVRQHDYREKEGTVIFLERETTVFAEWGAACYQGNISFLEQIIQKEYETGCTTGCVKVRSVIVHPNGQQEVQCHYPDGTTKMLENSGTETWCP